MFDVNKVALLMSYDYNSLINSNIYELSKRFYQYRMSCPHGMWVKTCRRSGIPYNKCNKLVRIYIKLFEDTDCKTIQDVASNRNFWEGLF